MKRILLGKIAAAHGIKGLVKVSFYGEDPALLESGSLYTAETGDSSVGISLKNPMGKFYLAEVEGCTSRNDAEALRGTELYIDRDRLPEIEEEGTFYYEDLMGLQALNKGGTEIGRVHAVHNFGAGDLLEIKPLSGETYLVPFTDEYVPAVTDTDVTIDYPDALKA